MCGGLDMGFRRLTLRVTAAAVFGVLLAGTTAISAQAKPAPPGPGNSPSAQQCHKGGWQNLATSTGATFANQDACVAYAAHGGVLRPKPSTTFTDTYSGCTETLGGICRSYSDLLVQGTGLLPGAQVIYCYTGGCLPWDLVAPDGTLNFDFGAAECILGSYWTTTTASGAPIQTAPATCTSA